MRTITSINLNAEPLKIEPQRDDSKRGFYRMVFADSYEMLDPTWELVSQFETEKTISVSEQKAVPSPNGGYPQIVQVTKYKVVKVAGFLYFKHADIVESETLSLNRELQALIKIIETRNERLIKEVERLKKEEEAKQAVLKNCADTNEAKEKEWIRLTNLNRKLEGDIAKIRQAIGELRMKEILEIA